MSLSFQHKVFQFKTPSGTSRGILTEKHAWFLALDFAGKKGIGECSIIARLSPDFESKKQYEELLDTFKSALEKIDFQSLRHLKEIALLEAVRAETSIYANFGQYPSLIFGFETALLNWASGENEVFFDTAFTRGKAKIPINGLVWMGSMTFMCAQMHEKAEQGFDCIKMKVGAIDFATEIEILEDFRVKHSPEEMILRVDANGAFSESNVREKLKALSKYGIHSIEQPIAPGQHELMATLCAENIIPIALDEELIGIHSTEVKKALLDKIKPQYIILKPSLHGGLLSCQEWIQLAEVRNIAWWMTSALESNVGLACIAQYTSTFPINKHHGLGTGSLYINNIESKLKVENGFIFYDI